MDSENWKKLVAYLKIKLFHQKAAEFNRENAMPKNIHFRSD